MTGRHRSSKRKLRAGYRAPSRRRRAMCSNSYFCLFDVLHCSAHHIFHRRVWYRALSLRYACIRCSGIILTLGYFGAKFRFVVELAAEKNCVLNHSLSQSLSHPITHSLTHPAYLMPRKPKLSLRNNNSYWWASWKKFRRHPWNQRYWSSLREGYFYVLHPCTHALFFYPSTPERTSLH